MNARSPLVASGIDGVERPDYSGASIVNVAVTAFLASGGASTGEPPLAPPLATDLDPFHGGRAEGPIVVFLVDGLGVRQLDHWAAGGSARSGRWARHARPISTVFPSTTTTALTSLSTGTPPGRHGLVGYRQYFPRFGVVADLLKMSPLGVAGRDLLIGPSWSPSDLTAAPTLFRRGLAAEVVTRGIFEGTGFTRLIYDGAPLAPYATGTDLAETLARLLGRETPPPVIFVYWDELDTIQHLHGPEPHLIDLELERVAHLIEFVAARMSPNIRRATTVLVTGDHGQVPAARASQISIESVPTVAAELARPLAGDRRAGFLSARPGRLRALESALSDILPAGSRILPMADAVDANLFGPPPFHPELDQRLGDLLVLIPSPGGLTYLTPGAARPSRHPLGAHGGLEPEELLVPLVAGPLAAFGPDDGESSARRADKT